MGAIITYGSYVDKKEKLTTLALQVTIADTLIALMAGVVIFPAVFALGGQPGEGPGLIFVTLPKIFSEMPLGGIFETLFFTLIGVAAITSTISLLEVVVSYFTEQFNMNRKTATIILTAVIFLIAIPNSLSNGPLADFTLIGDRTVFDTMDFFASNVFMPLGGLLTALFVGWAWGPKNAIIEATSDGLHKFKLQGLFSFFIKYLVPVGIIIVLLQSTGYLEKIVKLF